MRLSVSLNYKVLYAIVLQLYVSINSESAQHEGIS
jgi:hypothetical protein